MKKLVVALMLVLGTAASIVAQNSDIKSATMGRNEKMKSLRLLQPASAAKTVVTTFPYVMDFENGMADWTVADLDNDSFTWMLETSGMFAHSGTSAAISFSYDEESETGLRPCNLLSSPSIELPSEGSFELSWSVCPLDPSWADEYYEVLVSYGENAVDTLFSERLTGISSYQRRVLLLDAYCGQQITVHFCHRDTYDQFAILIDDITIQSTMAPEVSISAPRVARIGDAVTLTSHVLSANPVTSYQWSFSSAATPSSATTPVVNVVWNQAGTHPIQLVVSNENGSDTAISEITIVDCSSSIVAPYTEGFEAGLGCWTTLNLDSCEHNWESVEATFTALGYEGVGAELAHSGEDCVASWSHYPTAYSIFGIVGDDVEAYDVLVSPAIQLPTGQNWKLSFQAKSLGGADYPDSLEVRLATVSPSSLEDFSYAVFEPNALHNNFYNQYIFDISSFAGQTIYLGFIHHSKAMFNVVLDDVVIDSQIVGIDDVENAPIVLMPNPTQGRFEIRAEGFIESQVVDCSGRIVLSSNSPSVQLDNAPRGIYFVRVITDQGVFIQKIAKQ